MFRINGITLSLVLGGAVLSLGSFSIVSYAQERELALEEVLVTARKREESVQDIPVTVTPIGEQLTLSSVQSLQDLQNFVPNVTIDRVGQNNGAAISIRGISFQDPDKSLDSPVGVILDGVYMGTVAGGLLNNFDIERVEVLRGPQGTLFGKNTTAGALNIVRTAPTKEFGGKVKIGAGSWDKRQIQAVVNTPLSSKGGLKLFGNIEEHDGYIENKTINEDVASVDYQQLGFTVAFDIRDDFDISFTAERIEDKSDMGAFANFNDSSDLVCILSGSGALVGALNGEACSEFDSNSDEDSVSANQRNEGDVTNDFYNLTMNVDLDDNWTLTSITGYVERDEEFNLEYDASQGEFLNIVGEQDYEQITQELRINGDVTDQIKLTAGLYYFDSEYRQFQESFELWNYLGFGPTDAYPLGGGYPLNDVSQPLDGTGENTSYALFASMDWQLTDALSLNLGGRYTKEERKLSTAVPGFNSASLGDNFIPTGDIQKFEEDWNEFSPRVALQYTFSDDLMVFSSFSSGFKSGGFFARTQNVDDINSFDPEYVDTFEVGIKSEWLDNRIRFNATAFYSEYEDKQEEEVTDLGGGNVTTVVYNAADAEIQGLELEFTAQITVGLSAFLNVGFLDSEFSDFEIVDSISFEEVDVSDRDLRNAPDKTIGLGLDYFMPVSFGEFAAHYNYQWRDEYETVLNNDPRGTVDSGGFHNASIDLTINERHRISIYGRNLGDERYARVIPIGITTFGYYNPPRHYGIEFSTEF